MSAPSALADRAADEVLAALQGKAAIERMEGPHGRFSVRPPKVRYTHEAMIDLILENPWISQNQLAEHFGYSPGWISTVITSDAFKAQYEVRRAELLDPELRVTLRERFEALTVKSLQVLQEKLSRPIDQVPDQLALRAAELGAKSLGLGQTQTVMVTSEERLASLAHRLIALKQGAGDVVDVEARHISGPLGA